MSIKSVNPANGKILKTYKDHSTSQVAGMIQVAGDCFADWQKFAIHVRAKYLRDVANIMESQKKTLAELITLEMGKPILQSLSEIEKCVWVCRYYADNGKLFLKDNQIKTEAEKSFVSYEPLGIVLAVMPWNFPFWQVFRFAAPALIAGNVVLLKHASNVPQCALAIENIMMEAGLPRGAFQTLLISSTRVKSLVEHTEVKAVTLTGSEDAGSKVAAIAGRNIKKSVLELGGSDPFLVMKECNLKEAARVGIMSRMINAGQSCIAAKRFIVEAAVANSFIKLLKKNIEQLEVGDPMKEETDIGPIAREDLLKELAEQVKSSVKKGAKVEIGGGRVSRKGHFYKPTLITHVSKGMRLFDEEVFGPVVTVITVENEAEALAVANDTCYGLGAAIWTENMEQAMRMVKQVRAGNIVVNGMVRSDPRLPFGGINKSGYGRELSDVGLKEFVNIKSVVVN